MNLIFFIIICIANAANKVFCDEIYNTPITCRFEGHFASCTLEGIKSNTFTSEFIEISSIISENNKNTESIFNAEEKNANSSEKSKLPEESNSPENSNKNVKFLEISKTFTTINIPRNIGKFFPLLESFRMRKTSLKIIARKGLEEMENLRHLSLDSNQIEIIYPDALTELPNLETFFISNNKIDFLHPDLLANSPKLKYFWADYNQLEVLDEKIFRNNMELAWISLSHNKLRKVYVDFRIFKNLEFASVERNEKMCNFKFEKDGNENERNLNKFQGKIAQFCDV